MFKVFNGYRGTFEVTKEFYETFKDCLSIDPCRVNMSAVWFDGKAQTFVALDGRRMIWHRDATINSKYEGFYELAKIGKVYKLIPKNLDLQFLDWQRFIPDYSKDDLLTILDVRGGKEKSISSFSFSGNLSHDSRLLCQIVKHIGCIINLAWLLSVLKHVDSFCIYYAREDATKVIQFDIDENTTYIIVPMSP